MTNSIGPIIALFFISFIAWKGYKKFARPILWLGFFPTFSIAHALMGLYIIALAFTYDSAPENFPLFAKILAPSYAGVSLFGIPLEILGFPDDVAYSMAIVLNSILIAILIVLLIQLLKKSKTNNNT